MTIPAAAVFVDDHRDLAASDLHFVEDVEDVGRLGKGLGMTDTRGRAGRRGR